MTLKKPNGSDLLQFLSDEDWEIDYSQSADKLVLRHKASGNTWDFKDDGTLNVPAIETEEASIGPSGLPVPGIPSLSSVSNPSFNNWRTVSTDRPAYVWAFCRARTDGTNSGIVDLEIDLSGGVNKDYEGRVAYADPAMGDDASDLNTATALIPPGASYRLNNANDPKGGNVIVDLLEAEA